MLPGIAHVEPRSKEALRFATAVVEAITSGAEPVATVEVIWPDALTVVNAPVAGVVAPTVPFSGPATAVEVMEVAPWTVPSVVSVEPAKENVPAVKVPAVTEDAAWVCAEGVKSAGTEVRSAHAKPSTRTQAVPEDLM